MGLIESAPPEGFTEEVKAPTRSTPPGAQVTLAPPPLDFRPDNASDIAVLHNGFRIRHERRKALGTVTRLYFSIDDKTYVDVPTNDIERFERDKTPAATQIKQSTAAPPGSAQAASFPGTVPARPVSPGPSAADFNEAVNSASAAYKLDPDLMNIVIHAESGSAARPSSPERTAQHLRELLERYNFDLVKALAAYDVGPERVEQCNCVPPDARAYVARIVREYNTKKIEEKR